MQKSTNIHYITLCNRYFYWNRRSTVLGQVDGLYRVTLDAVRSMTENCPGDIEGSSLVVSSPILDTFTLEPDAGIYYIGNCTGGTDTGLTLTTLNTEDSNNCITQVLFEVRTLDSFSEIIFIPLPDEVNVGIFNASLESQSTHLASASGVPRLIRTYRSVKQPLPSMCIHMFVSYELVEMSSTHPIL